MTDTPGPRDGAQGGSSHGYRAREDVPPRKSSFTSLPPRHLPRDVRAGTAIDHGGLGGLDDDDHTQYLHLEVPRVVTAEHTFQNNQTFEDVSITGVLGLAPAGGSITSTLTFLPGAVQFNGDILFWDPEANGYQFDLQIPTVATQPVDIQATLDVTGATTLDSLLTVNSSTDLNGNLNVQDAATFQDNLLVQGDLDVQGRAAFQDGTELLPGVTNIGDLNTGMWWPANDTIAFSLAGSEVLRLASGGIEFGADLDLGTNRIAFGSGPWEIYDAAGNLLISESGSGTYEMRIRTGGVGGASASIVDITGDLQVEGNTILAGSLDVAGQFDVEWDTATLARHYFSNPNTGNVQTDLMIGRGTSVNDIIIGVNWAAPGAPNGFIDSRTTGRMYFAESGSIIMDYGPTDLRVRVATDFDSTVTVAGNLGVGDTTPDAELGSMGSGGGGISIRANFPGVYLTEADTGATAYYGVSGGNVIMASPSGASYRALTNWNFESGLTRRETASGVTAYIEVTSAANANNGYQFQTNDVLDWLLYRQTDGDFAIARYNTSGVFQDTPLVIDRSTGNLETTNTWTHDGIFTSTGQYIRALNSGNAAVLIRASSNNRAEILLDSANGDFSGSDYWAIYSPDGGSQDFRIAPSFSTSNDFRVGWTGYVHINGEARVGGFNSGINQGVSIQGDGSGREKMIWMRSQFGTTIHQINANVGWLEFGAGSSLGDNMGLRLYHATSGNLMEFRNSGTVTGAGQAGVGAPAYGSRFRLFAEAWDTNGSNRRQDSWEFYSYAEDSVYPDHVLDIGLGADPSDNWVMRLRSLGSGTQYMDPDAVRIQGWLTLQDQPSSTGAGYARMDWKMLNHGVVNERWMSWWVTTDGTYRFSSYSDGGSRNDIFLFNMGGNVVDYMDFNVSDIRFRADPTSDAMTMRFYSNDRHIFDFRDASTSTTDATLIVNLGGDFQFRTGGGSAYVHFDAADQRVGIGTTTPNYKLDVSGTLRAVSSIIGDDQQIGYTVQALYAADANSDYALRTGSQRFVRNTSLVRPTGATSYGYYHVLGRRDTSGGYAGLWGAYNPGELWVVYSTTSTGFNDERILTEDTPTFSGTFTLRGASGSSASPSYAFASATGSGMWHGSSTLEFSVNGVRRLQLTGNRVRHYGSGEAYFESRPVASNGGGFIWYDGSNPRWLMATTGGTNLRLYSYTAVADIIRFEANGDINLGTNILFVDRSANQVGINDTTPAYSLDVNGSFRVTGASLMGTLTMTGDLNVATSLLFVDQSATRVGINDNNPSYTLDVNGSFRVSGAVKGGTTHAGTVSSYAPSSWPTPTVSLNMTAAGSTNINFFGVDSGDCHTIIVHNTSGASRTLTFTNYDGLGTGLSSSQSVANGETWVLVASGFPGPGGSGTEVIVTLAAQY